jgi:hypothetical protein
LEEVRDVFIFCCYTGFAYSDVQGFVRNAVTMGIDGEKWLCTHRVKTDKKESVPLCLLLWKLLRSRDSHSLRHQ